MSFGHPFLLLLLLVPAVAVGLYRLAAESAAKAFLDRVPKRLRVALIVFSGEVQVATPPTTDHALVRQAIDEVGNFSGFGGTAIGDALARAVELGQEAAGGELRTL